jgi:hypothetical protein
MPNRAAAVNTPEVLGQRITTVEGGLSNLQSAIERTSVSFQTALNAATTNFNNALSTETAALSSDIRALANEFRSSSRTPWPMIWTALGVSFAIVVGVGALAYRPLLETQSRFERIMERENDHNEAQRLLLQNQLDEIHRNQVIDLRDRIKSLEETARSQSHNSQ